MKIYVKRRLVLQNKLLKIEQIEVTWVHKTTLFGPTNRVLLAKENGGIQ